MEQQIGQNDEDRFRIRNIHTVTNGIRPAENTQRDRTNQGDTHPAHANITGNRNILQGTDGHKAHDNVRLTEIPQAPGNRRQPTDEGQAFRP